MNAPSNPPNPGNQRNFFGIPVKQQLIIEKWDVTRWISFTPSPFRITLPSLQPRAFSLVEVTIALGILAFVGVTILTLLPTALNSMQDTAMETISARIASQVVADLQQVEIGSASNAISQKSFDSEGVETTGPQAVYRVFVSDTPHVVPGASAGDLHRIAVQVVRDPAQSVTSVATNGFANIPLEVPAKTFQFFVLR